MGACSQACSLSDSSHSSLTVHHSGDYQGRACSVSTRAALGLSADPPDPPARGPGNAPHMRPGTRRGPRTRLLATRKVYVSLNQPSLSPSRAWRPGSSTGMKRQRGDALPDRAESVPQRAHDRSSRHRRSEQAAWLAEQVKEAPPGDSRRCLLPAWPGCCRLWLQTVATAYQRPSCAPTYVAARRNAVDVPYVRYSVTTGAGRQKSTHPVLCPLSAGRSR